jgi:uncharacterized protein (DUF169 family)
MNDIQALLNLSKPPIAIAFMDAVPDNIEAWEGGPVPAGCYFWRVAQEGRTFYTVASDHYNCAIGAHTHHIPLPPDRAGELPGTVGFMVQNGYIAMEEVPGIPTLSATPAAIAYGPADAATFDPTVVLVAAQPAEAMLLYEAALQVSAGSALMPSLGRPGCAVLPLTVNQNATSISLGCAGNRAFTGIPASEMYVCIPGSLWAAVVEHTSSVIASNMAMQTHYNNHKAGFFDRDFDCVESLSAK